MLTVLTSGKAAPGTTTATWALALAWPRPVLVADCDPAGGDMAPGFLAGRVMVDRGLLSLAGAARRTPGRDAVALLGQHVVDLPEHPNVWFLPGFASGTQAASFTTDDWNRLSSALQDCSTGIGRDVLVDTGRLGIDSSCWPVIRAADRVLLTVRPSVRSVHAAQAAAQRLRTELVDPAVLSVLVVGDGLYSPTEVASALELPLSGSLPYDPTTAAALSDATRLSTRALQRSPLLRVALTLSGTIANPGAMSYLSGVTR